VHDQGEEYGHYTAFRKDDAMVAAVTPKMPDMEDVPDGWMVYFGVADTDSAHSLAEAAGGNTLVDPLTVGVMAIIAMLTDTTGAAFGLWQPNQHRGFEVFGEAGAPCWFELQTSDILLAEAFYTSAFSIRATKTDTGEGGPAYRTLEVAGEAQAGIVDASGVMPEGSPSFWMVYFGVRDIDEASRYVEGHGGRVVTQPMDSPYGRWTVVADPQDAPFAILEVRNRLGVG
jgi:predicted enzyme related to lactoylglutathione lyase